MLLVLLFRFERLSRHTDFRFLDVSDSITSRICISQEYEDTVSHGGNLIFLLGWQ